MGKLTLPNIFLSVKQNLSYVWFLRPPVLGKLTLPTIFLSVKQNLSYVWYLRPSALDKLILSDIFSFFPSVKAYPKLYSAPQTLGNLIFFDTYLSVEQNESCLSLIGVCDNSLHCWYLFNSFKLLARKFNWWKVLSSQETVVRDIYLVDSRIAYPNCLTYILECV